MKIYFAGSIRGGREDKELYLQLIKHLAKYGQIFTEHIGDKELNHLGEEGISDNRIYHRDLCWLKDSDIVVAEVSTPSLGVGYEIARAECTGGKQIWCLYRTQENRKLSAMISGNPNLRVVKYESLEEVIEKIDCLFGELEEQL